MALPPLKKIRKQQAVLDILTNASNKSVLELLELNPFLNEIHNLPLKDTEELLTHLKDSSSSHHNAARTFIKEAAQANATKINTLEISRITPTKALEKKFINIENRALLDNILNSGASLCKSMVFLQSPLRIPLDAFKIITNSAALTVGFTLQVDQKKRVATMAGLTKPFIIAGGAFIYANVANAAINSEEKTPPPPPPISRKLLDQMKKPEINGGITSYAHAPIPSPKPTDTEAFNAIRDAFDKRKALLQTPTPRPRPEFANTSKHEVAGLKVNTLTGKATYTNGHYTWKVPSEVYQSNFLTANITGIPVKYIFAVQAVESSFNPNIINEIRACGLSQFVPGTLHEKTYKYGDVIGFPKSKELIKRYVKRRNSQGDPYYGYKPINEQARKTLEKICLDTDFNTRLGAVNMALDIRHLQKKLARFSPAGKDYYPITQLHAYVAHFAGGGAGYKILKDALSNNGNTPVYEFFSKRARNNKTNKKLLYVNGDQNNPRTTKQYLTYLKNKKGLSNSVLPDMRDWSSFKHGMKTALSQLNTNKRNITPNNLRIGSLPSLNNS